MTTNKNKVYRAEFVNAIQEHLKTHYNQNFSKALVDNFILSYNSTLEDFFLNGKSVQTPIGQYKTYLSKPLVKVIPYSGEKKEIPPRLKVKFVPSKSLKENLHDYTSEFTES